MNNSKRPILIGFGSVKGGVGKSSISEIFSSYLSYGLCKRIMVYDLDEGQYSFWNLRERELKVLFDENVSDPKSMHSHFAGLVSKSLDSSPGKEPYKICKSTCTKILEEFENIYHNDDYDYIIFDLPGRFTDDSLVRLSLCLDYIVSPIEADKQSLSASMLYVTSILKIIKGSNDYNLKQLFVFWNKVDNRMRPTLIDKYSESFSKLGLIQMSTRLPMLSRYSKEFSLVDKEVFRSTLLTPDTRSLKGTNFKEFADELIERVLYYTRLDANER